MLMSILGGVVALIVLLAVAAFFFPREYRVERAIVVQAKPEAVLAQLADLRAWRNWGIWFERDPGMKVTYSEKQGELGAWSSWESKTEGNGRATLTLLAPNRVAYDLEFADMGMKSRGSFALTPEGSGVRVVWSDSGDLGNNPLNRWFGLFLDQMIGPDFEAGLAKLKRNLEK